MASLTTLIIISILVFVLWNVALHFLKKMFQNIFTIVQIVGSVIIIGSAIFLGLFMYDSYKLVQSFQEGTVVFVVADQEDVIMGMKSVGGNSSILSDAEVSTLSSLLTDGKYAEMRKDADRMVVFTKAMFEAIPESDIGTPYGKLTTSEATEMAFDQNLAPFPEMSTKDMKMVKVYLIAELLNQQVMGPKNQLFFITQFKEGNIAVYPKGMVFWALERIPLSFVEGQFEQESKQ